MSPLPALKSRILADKASGLSARRSLMAETHIKGTAKWLCASWQTSAGIDAANCSSSPPAVDFSRLPTVEKPNCGTLGGHEVVICLLKAFAAPLSRSLRSIVIGANAANLPRVSILSTLPRLAKVHCALVTKRLGAALFRHGIDNVCIERAENYSSVGVGMRGIVSRGVTFPDNTFEPDTVVSI